MHDIVVAFAKWCEATPWGVMTRESIWAYPVVQLTHFTGLSLWLGTNFALDLRLLGIGNRKATPAQVAQDLFIWNWIGFAIVLAGLPAYGLFRRVQLGWIMAETQWFFTFPAMKGQFCLTNELLLVNVNLQ